MKKLFYLLFVISFLFIISCNDTEKKSSSSTSIKKISTMDVAGYEKAKMDNKGKVILMNFFAPWCGPCNLEAPDLVKAYKESKGKLEIISLAIDTNEADVNDFINKYGINFKIYLADRALQRKFGISSIPTNIIYSPKGDLLTVRVGGVSSEALKSLVDKYTK